MSLSDPLFLSKEQVLAFHNQQLELFGGQAGVGDMSLLESALFQPLNIWLYQQGADLFDLASAYAFHLAKNHPFHDGNKRTAFQACLAFLAGNGIIVDAEDLEIYDHVIKLTTSTISKTEFAEYLRTHSKSEP
jgi:death-on-curing protein